MKRIKKIGISILLISIIQISICQAKTDEVPFHITIEVPSTVMQEGQKEISFYLKLETYDPIDKQEQDFIASLGYQGELHYDSSIFEKVTITSLNNWEKAEYNEATGIMLSTTTQAKENTRIAKITFRLKDTVVPEQIKINIQDLIVSDGNQEQTIQQAILFEKEKKEVNQTTNQMTNEVILENQVTNTTVVTNTQQNSSVVNELPLLTTNQIIQGTNTPTVEKVSEAVKDTTTASTTIPQTGSGIEYLIALFVIAVIGIFGYIRYRMIQIK